MNFLVANYDSDSDSSYSAEESKEKKTAEEDNDLVAKNYLIDSVSSDEEESSDVDKNVIQYNEKKQDGVVTPEITKLPPPLLDTKVTSSIKTASAQNSVFVSHFQKEEDAKLSILQKHVKVTEIEKRSEIGGKKVCWNYRKGKCRKGHRCAFAHDNDIPLPVPEEEASEAADIGHGQSHSSVQLGSGYFSHFSEQNIVAADLPDDDSYMGNLKRKKKYGVNDNLLPPKKAFNDLQKQRSKERPWTVNQD